MSELLDDAAAAFRRQQDRSRPAPGDTRRRLLGSLRRRERLRRWQWSGVIVLGLAMTNSTTWAWSTGRLEEPLTRMANFLGTQRSERGTTLAHSDDQTARAGSTRARLPAPSADRADVEGARERRAESADTLVAEPTPRTHGAAPEGAAETRIGAAVPIRPSASMGGGQPAAANTPRRSRQAGAQREEDDALGAALEELAEPRDVEQWEIQAFRRAHRAHFDGAAPAAALAGWDAYLARFPRGRFEPEARFNRAVCLVRLGRDEEARAALRPIAEQDASALRQREAQRLLGALDRGDIVR